MKITGTVYAMAEGTSKTGKPWKGFRLKEIPTIFQCYNDMIAKQNIHEGDKVEITTWAKCDYIIDKVYIMPPETQITAGTIDRSKDTTSPPPQQDDKTTDIQWLAVAKAVGQLDIPLKVLTNEEVTVFADNVVNITNRVIELWRK